MVALAAVTVLTVVLGSSCGGVDGGSEQDADREGSLDTTRGSAAAPDASSATTAETELPGDGDSSAREGAGTSTDASHSGRAPLSPLDIVGEIIRDHNLADGDCFNRIEELVETRRMVITSRLSCNDPHMYEVFHTFELDVPHPAIYPGDDKMGDYARKLCYEQFAAFVGEVYELSVYEIGVFTPDRVNFEHEVARYRSVHCWLHRSDGQQMTTSARGTAI